MGGTLTLKPVQNLVPRSQYDVAPSYLVWGGFVFQRLSRDFLATWDDWDSHAPTRFISHYEYGLPTPDCAEVVVLSRVWPTTSPSARRGRVR